MIRYSFKIKGHLLSSSFIILGFIFLAVAGVLLNFAGDSISIFGKTYNPRVGGVGFIAAGVFLYFIGRILSTFHNLKLKREQARQSRSSQLFTKP